MKSLLLFPDGVGLRNFVLTRFLSLLIENGDAIIWHALPEQIVQTHINNDVGKVRWQALPYHHEGQLPFLFRRAKLLAQLFWQDEPGTDLVLKQIIGAGKGVSRFRNLLAEVIGYLGGQSHARILWLERLHVMWVEREPYFNEYLDFLEKEKPDIVFCSHQRSEIAVPAILAARKLGIPTATFIYSWDNLPKGRMAVHADYFLVWSEHMRGEMLRYYPDILDRQIIIVGTPQFEHLLNTELIESREMFFQKLGLDINRPVICFSGDDLVTSPFDQDYLGDLAEGLRKIPVQARPQILFRKNPTDKIDRYEKVLTKYKEICRSDPVWISQSTHDWSKVIPTSEDIGLLVNVVYHCDLVVNVGSTMALDFAILDKPAIYLAYNPISWNQDCPWSIEKVYKYPHFNHLVGLNPIYWARSREDLADLIVHALNNPRELQQEREKWIKSLVQTPLELASMRCVMALRDIANKSKP